jgi:hypothetical protein
MLTVTEGFSVFVRFFRAFSFIITKKIRVIKNTPSADERVFFGQIRFDAFILISLIALNTFCIILDTLFCKLL